MTYLILDTNIWIYLANGYDSSKNTHHEDVHFELIKKLIEKIELEEIQLVANDIIIKEWDRNKTAKETYIDKLNNLITSNSNYFKLIEKDLDSEHKKMLSAVQEHYNKALQGKMARSKFHIDQVEELLKGRSTIFSIPDHIIHDVSNLAIEKKAPFHRNKNCTADAQILLSSIDFLKDKIDGIKANAIFVTNNREDFCVSLKDNQIHPDLKP